ncbi:restriction endonuclease [Peptococcaceae bacterium CEB3]|nr:restriction endonuclease [Peptococcaceae bacterium CEB3]
MPRYSYRKFNAARKRYGLRFRSKQGHQFLIVVGGLVALDYTINHPYVILALGSFVLFVSSFRKWSTLQAIRKSGIEQIDRMSGTEFEKRLAVLFCDLGYSVKLTPNNDFGADVVVENYRGGRTVVQAKRYSKPVGIKAIQEVVGSMGYYEAINALVITNKSFTPQAEKLATKNGVELWDRQQLIHKINSAARGMARLIKLRTP